MRWIARADFPQLVDALRADGARLVGPMIRDHAIVYDELGSADDLPRGWTDRQAPGRYRLERRVDDALFGYVVGPHSWKDVLFPAREPLYQARRREDGRVGFDPILPAGPQDAFLGVRACEIAAMGVQDRVFGQGPHREPRYFERRGRALVVAVNCTEPGDLCFCASTGTGPRVTGGADLTLTEEDDGFVVEVGSARGEALLDALPVREATEEERETVDTRLEAARGRMGRAMNVEGLPGILFGNLDHPRWKDVADRCLACGNCTSVCPTCFCTGTEEKSDLDGTTSEHVRFWQSCFTEGHSDIHGATFRPEVRDRYRQWLTHKVGAWVSQFGTSGCVGCGRCIAWCPVGIDLTEEVAALRADAHPPVEMPDPPSSTEPVDDDLTPRPAEVMVVSRETRDVVTLHLRADWLGAHAPGQFCQLVLPAVGEVPISISGTDGISVEHTVRAVGAVTRALCALRPGDEVGLRGPYGRPWPLEAIRGRPVVVVAGGIGLAPLRGAVREMLDRPDDFPEVHLFYGARTPEDVLYGHEMLSWVESSSFRLHVTVDQATPSWRGHVGVVTRLLGEDVVSKEASALICGPEVMMRFTVDTLRERGLRDDRLWVTMERHMKCATGFCGRCQYGPWFVCKDGPVFRYDRIRLLFDRDGY